LPPWALLTPVNLLDYRRRNELPRTPGAETTVSFVLVSLPIVRAAIDLAVRHRCPATAGVAPQWPLGARRRFPYMPVIASAAPATRAVSLRRAPSQGHSARIRRVGVTPASITVVVDARSEWCG
jgi:hypothetical protein